MNYQTDYPHLKKLSTTIENQAGLISLRAFIGVETAALTFRAKQYSTSYSSHMCRDKKMRVLVQTTTFRPLLWCTNAVDGN